MNSELQMTSSVAQQVSSNAVFPRWRLFAWSLRRELWENRWVWLAPIVVAAVSFFGSFIGIARRRSAIDVPFMFAEGLIMFTTTIVSFFYALDAFYGERRDRSILFWKSMPVSDVTTVLAKAGIPIVIMPLFTFVLTVALQFAIAVAALLGGRDLTQVSVGHMWTGLLFHLVTVHGLSWAPIFGWLLFVSAFARRAPFVWAVVPPLAIAMIEKIAFGTTTFAHMLAVQSAGGEMSGGGSMHFQPDLAFFARPGLMIGLLVAGAFIAAAARLRRSSFRA